MSISRLQVTARDSSLLLRSSRHFTGLPTPTTQERTPSFPPTKHAHSTYLKLDSGCLPSPFGMFPEKPGDCDARILSIVPARRDRQPSRKRASSPDPMFILPTHQPDRSCREYACFISLRTRVRPGVCCCRNVTYSFLRTPVADR